jgi:hypothetical protein
MLAPALIALSSLAPTFARAQASNSGPWVQTKNGYYSTARLSWMNPNTYFNADGVRVGTVPPSQYHGRNVTLDTEYGVSNRLTLHLAMPVFFQSMDLPALPPGKFTNNGFGDLTFGFKYGFLAPTSRQALALELDANTPTGYNPYGVGLPPLGIGKFNAGAHLYGGMTLDPAPVYVQAQVGYLDYTDSALSDALTYGAEAGVYVTPRVLILGDLAAQKGRDDTKAYFYSFTQVEGLVQYRMKPHLDVMAGYVTVLSGKNATKRNELRLGVALKGNRLGKYRGQAAAGAAEGTFPGMAPRAIVPVPAPAPAPADTSHAPSQPK